ncbi:MAG: hypothetical protein OES34_11045 [Nitrosopumilus sp.]|nr:hypothetical protein [Nitrosopumilus sp.]
MPYNPHIQDRSGELYAQGISQAGRSIGRGIDKYGDRRREQKEKAKRDAGFQKGLEGIQEHAPDLYKEYFGDQSPQELGVNQINAMLKFHDLRAADIGYKQAVYEFQQKKHWNENELTIHVDKTTGQPYAKDNNGQIIKFGNAPAPSTGRTGPPQEWGLNSGATVIHDPNKEYKLTSKPNAGNDRRDYSVDKIKTDLLNNRKEIAKHESLKTDDPFYGAWMTGKKRQNRITQLESENKILEQSLGELTGGGRFRVSPGTSTAVDTTASTETATDAATETDPARQSMMEMKSRTQQMLSWVQADLKKLKPGSPEHQYAQKQYHKTARDLAEINAALAGQSGAPASPAPPNSVEDFYQEWMK